MLISFSVISRVGLMLLIAYMMIKNLWVVVKTMPQYLIKLQGVEEVKSVASQLSLQGIVMALIGLTFTVMDLDNFEKIQITMWYYLATIIIFKLIKNIKELYSILASYLPS